MAHHGKTYDEAKKRYDREREYTPAEAISLVKQLARVKFNESVEVHVRTGLNVRHADEQLRGTVALPNGLGKVVTIAGFAQGDNASEGVGKGARARRRCPTMSARMTSPSAFRTVSTTSTSRSPRRT